MPKTNFRGNEFSALGLNSAYSSKYTRIWQILRDAGAPDFRHRQIFKAIFQDRITRFSDMVALPKPLRLKLATEFGDEILSLKRVATKKLSKPRKPSTRFPAGNVLKPSP